MAYGQRDKLLQTIAVFTTSEKIKELPMAERQELLADIRDLYCPDISNDEWGEISKGINNFKFVITDSIKYGKVPNIPQELPKSDEPGVIAESELIPEPEPTPELIPGSTEMQHQEEPEPGVLAKMERTEPEPEIKIIDEKDLDVSSDEEEGVEEGVTEEQDFDEPEPTVQKEEPKPAEHFGRFLQSKEPSERKVNTSTLRGLLKKKKID